MSNINGLGLSDTTKALLSTLRVEDYIAPESNDIDVATVMNAMKQKSRGLSRGVNGMIADIKLKNAAVEKIDAEMANVREKLATAKKNKDEAGIADHTKTLENLRADRSRLNNESQSQQLELQIDYQQYGNCWTLASNFTKTNHQMLQGMLANVRS